MTVDLNGGTLFDWWTEHISKVGNGRNLSSGALHGKRGLLWREQRTIATE